MSDELIVMKDVLARLDRERIPYMVTGSIAASFYTTPRMTRDVDIVIELDQKDATRIFETFKNDFYIDQDMISEAIRMEKMFNVIHNKSVVKVDFIVRKSEPYRKVEFERKRQIDAQGTKIWVVSKEDLVISKLFWAKDNQSDLQLKDVRNILSQGKTDQFYLKKWIRELDLEDIYEKVQK